MATACGDIALLPSARGRLPTEQSKGGAPRYGATRYGAPAASYAIHGSTVFNPAASNGAVSRVATIMPLAAAVAAM